MEQKQKLEAKYGLFTAISMVIGQVIGSGIFFKVDDILVATQGNSFAGFVGWIIVGFTVIFGAISMAYYAELVPKDGGIMAYVNYRFGDRAAALTGWVNLCLFYPLLAAVIFTVSGIYIAHLIGEFTGLEPTFLHYSLIGLVNLLIFFTINVLSPKASGLFQQLTTVLKLIPLIFISATAVIMTVGGSVPPTNSYVHSLQSIPESQSLILLIAASFVPIAFAFDGWYVATQISGEIKNAKKNLPRALIIGTVIVMVVYLLYYTGIIYGMTGQEILHLKDVYITEYARKMGSDIGALLIQLFIIISVLGTANGLLLATTRVPYQFYNLEKSKKFLNLGKIREDSNMPINSAIFGTISIIFYIFFYYFTNTHEFFTSKNYDFSAIPIVTIYIVNGALFIGLLSLIKKNEFSGNPIIKTIMAIIAFLGVLLVLVGTATAPNGISYIIIAFLFYLSGFFFIKK